MLKEILFKVKLRKADPFSRAKLYAEFYNLNMGEGCKIFGKADFGSEPYLVDLGNKVMLSDQVCFFTHDGGVQVISNMGLFEQADSFGKIKVCDNVFIGHGALILKGVTIGENVVIGAGALVTKDCEPNSVYAGVPAKRIKSIFEYYDGCKDNLVHTADLTPDEKEKYLKEKYEVD